LSSHVFTIIPVHDIESELFGNGSRFSYGKSHGQNKCIDSKALHYLYCPKELEDISCEEFYLKFNVIQRSATNQKDIISYTDSNYDGTEFMGIALSKEKNRIPKYSNFWIPDACSFNCNISKSRLKSTEITEDMESFARRVLIIYGIYRNIGDIQIKGSYVRYFQRWRPCSEFDARIKSILKNIQDIKNANKLICHTEKLKGETIPYQST
jgi:hypothetical protein